MGPDLEINGVSAATKDIVMLVEGGECMGCESNCQGSTFEMGASMNEEAEGVDRIEDLDVNILDCTKSCDNKPIQADISEASGNSSSFGDTICDFENDYSEVVSKSRGESMSPTEFDGFGEVLPMRKKKLTSHWRTFVRPLVWRCKWVELQIKKLQSQAIKYDKEIAECNKKQKFELGNFTLEELGTKSLPFSGQNQAEKVMKRKKRKRVEDTLDIASYMSHHNLFSYYETRRSTADGVYLDDDYGNLGRVIPADMKFIDNELGAADELLQLESRDGDEFLEQILSKIGIVQARVSNLKTRFDRVMSENAGKLSSIGNLNSLLPSNTFNRSAQDLASPPSNGEGMPVGSSHVASEPIPSSNTDHPVKVETAISSHEDLTSTRNIIESTDHPRVWSSSNYTVDGILIYSRRGKGDPKNHGKVTEQPTENPILPKEEPMNAMDDEPVLTFPFLEDLHADDQPTPKIRSIAKITAPNNKRKRTRRKARAGRWSKRL